MSSSMRVKGNAFVSTHLAFKKRYGPDRAARLASQLTMREFAEDYPSRILRTAWYPFEALVEVWTAFEALSGTGNGDVVFQVARDSAREDLNTILRVYLSVFGSPRLIAERSALVWRSFYDGGQLEVSPADPSDPHFLKLQVHDIPSPHRYLCASIQGWSEGGFEMTRAKHVVSSHPRCRLRGHPFCEFEFRWNE